MPKIRYIRQSLPSRLAKENKKFLYSVVKRFLISNTNKDNFIRALAYQSDKEPEILFLSPKENTGEPVWKRGLIFSASVTVTTGNLKEVSSDSFIESLSGRGCKAVFFVEFVPVTEESRELAPGDPEREYMAGEITRLRRQYPEMVFISFPGDEKSSGGCVAAGRGFFHINSHGGAEPCPFSPYSDVNVRDTGLKGALHSPLFIALQSGDLLSDDHRGGCVLYEKREQVQELMDQSRKCEYKD